MRTHSGPSRRERPLLEALGAGEIFSRLVLGPAKSEALLASPKLKKLKRRDVNKERDIKWGGLCEVNKNQGRSSLLTT